LTVLLDKRLGRYEQGNIQDAEKRGREKNVFTAACVTGLFYADHVNRFLSFRIKYKLLKLFLLSYASE
jgi:hypothetical protein